MALVPLPPGTLVKGTIGSLYVPGCRGHIFQVGKAFEADYSQGSGWVQSATCLVCGSTTLPFDIEWWQEIATLQDLHNTISLVQHEEMRLRDILMSLDRIASRACEEPIVVETIEMADFG